MDEFSIGDHTYKVTGRLNAFKQLYVVKRLAPALGELLPLLTSYLQRAESDAGRAEAAEVFGPFATAVSKLQDEDLEYIITTCLSIVQRRLPGGTGWSALIVKGKLIQEDLSLPEMLQLTWKVIEANLLGFTAAAGQQE